MCSVANLFPVLIACLLLSLGRVHGDLSTGLLVHFPLDETTGTTARELVGGKNGTIGSATWADPGIQLRGDTYVTAPAPDTQLTSTFTVGCWVKLDGYHYRAGIYELSRDTRLFLFQCGLRLDEGAGRFVYYNSYSASNFEGYQEHFLGSSGIIPLNTWTHIGVTYDGTTWRSYMNGQLDNEAVVDLTFEPAQTQAIGGRYFGHSMRGAVQDLRLYNRALSGDEMKALAPFRMDPVLVGLWVGHATLNEVKEVKTGSWSSTPAAMQQSILLHVNASGEGRLLQEATLMRTREETPTTVVVNDQSQIPNYDGLVRRGGKVVGQRFSCATLSLPNGYISLSGDNGWLAASIQMGRADPGNPFRHKYHPDLAVGRDVQRTLRIHFADGDSATDNKIGGTLWESVGGIHKDTIEARGPITFTRVTTSGQLR